MISHIVFESAVYKGCFSEKGKFTPYNAIFINEFVAYDTVIIAFAGLNSHILEREFRAALIVKHTAFGVDCFAYDVNGLSSVAYESKSSALIAFVCNAVVERYACVFRQGYGRGNAFFGCGNYGSVQRIGKGFAFCGFISFFSESDITVLKFNFVPIAVFNYFVSVGNDYFFGCLRVERAGRQG